MSRPVPKSRKNGTFGYKAVMVRGNGSTHVCIQKNFKTPEEALDYAKRYVQANYDGNPLDLKSGGNKALNGLSPEAARWHGR